MQQKKQYLLLTCLWHSSGTAAATWSLGWYTLPCCSSVWLWGSMEQRGGWEWWRKTHRSDLSHKHTHKHVHTASDLDLSQTYTLIYKLRLVFLHRLSHRLPIDYRSQAILLKQCNSTLKRYDTQFRCKVYRLGLADKDLPFGLMSDSWV